MHAASAKWPHLLRQTWRPAEILIRTLEAQLVLQHDQSVPDPNRATSWTMFECIAFPCLNVLHYHV